MQIGTLLNPDEMFLIVEALNSLIKNSPDTPEGKATAARCHRLAWQLEGATKLIRT